MSDLIELEKYKIHGSMEKLRKALASRKETPKFSHITFRDRKGFEKKEYSQRPLESRVYIPEFEETLAVPLNSDGPIALMTKDNLSVHEFMLWEIDGDKVLYVEVGSKSYPA